MGFEIRRRLHKRENTVEFEQVTDPKALSVAGDGIYSGSFVPSSAASATIGAQTSPTVSQQFSFNSASLSNGTALSWTLSAPSTPSAFTDDPLTAGSTPIKVVHITELRSRINTVRARFGLLAFSWTDASLSSATPVKAVHLTELRTALQQAYTAAGQLAPTFMDSTIVQGSTFIRVVHIKELRDAVMTLEGS